MIKTSHRDPALVYLATHGAADPVNPVDGGLLWFADGRWAARDIQNLPLRGGRPLVVLSACQTGLGKTFDVGVIGMAQAWERAGARSLVMSLWRVDDAATSQLMRCFLKEALKQPPDKALQAAMKALRAKDPDPAHWASFAVYGLPGR
jgi:CHAT domain-containing protein